ncbi:uncharacterized protein BJ212DRAFT_1390486 [Suillus subaureus]|uniref:Uncharacterized protein n=1 Tax=Suillus subaureus TaxID=48587 RepID=A0A9P7J6Y6_9AGAM|nr:uncharacterized protein BJ212DRAFT_1390486 [Suillus subaureus]KAG1805799.1 hypothetical protein BJ212DRAFT_1390486 [Suillus subaureus]
MDDDPTWWPLVNFCRFYNYFLAACFTAVVYDWGEGDNTFQGIINMYTIFKH